MKKSMVSIILIFLLSFASLADENNISDTEGHWAEETIHKLMGNDVISGYPDGTFRPDNMINVDEFIKICVSSLPDYSYDNSISYTYWATPYIQYALDNNIIKEDDYTKFDRSITREEMALMSIKTLSKLEMIMSVDNTGLELEINDYNEISDDMKDSVLRAYGMGILTGKPGDIYDPKGYATRAEASVVIDRLKEKSARKPFDFDVPYFTYKYSEPTEDGYVESEIKVLAPKDKNGVVKTDVVDLFNIGETMKDKYRVDATVGYDEHHIATSEYMYRSSYNVFDQELSITLAKMTTDQMTPYDTDMYIDLKIFRFQYIDKPIIIGFYGFNNWSYYESKYHNILDVYMSYIFGEDKVYIISIIDSHMTELKGKNDYSVKNYMDETYFLKNGRTVNMQSTGNSTYVIYIGNTK